MLFRSKYEGHFINKRLIKYRIHDNNQSKHYKLESIFESIYLLKKYQNYSQAKIGLMKSSDQLIAMEMMSVLPLKKIYVPIFYAGAISVPLLTGIFCSVGVLGGYFITVVILGVDAGAFWSQMQNSVDLHHDILNGAIKSVCFALVINLIAIYEGIISKPTADGVSRAVTNTVVISALSVLAVDFILTSFMFTGA